MPGITQRTLSCGTPLVIEHIEGVRSAALCWMTPGGSAFDPIDGMGRSTMWEELLMRGAGGRDSHQQADAFDRLGVGRSVDVGTYYMRLGASMLGERVVETIGLMADMVLRPAMHPDDVDPARDLALQGIASLKDDPQERAMLGARRRHLPEPVNRSGLGTPEGLMALTRESLFRDWSMVAQPGGSIIAMAGAIDADAVVNAWERALAGWSGATSMPRSGPLPVRGYEHEQDDTNQAQIIVCHDAPTELADESILEKIILSVLSGGMSGRLFTEVREKRGLCYSVSAGYRGDKDYGLVTGYVGTTPERAQDSLNVLLAEMARINSSSPADRITLDEFNRAVAGMKSRLVFSGESTGARASALAADMHVYGRPRSLEEIARKIDRVTLDQVNGYLSTRKMGTMTIQTLGPKALVPPAM
ncbi:MAG: insulinase family protein [Phycisphaerales bacterium]|nr:insulinase family protein [Phycisphaerales bacterium]